MVIRVALVNDDEVVVRGLDAMMRNYSHRVEVVELVAGKPVAQPVDVALYDTFGMGQGNGPAVQRLVDSPQVRSVAVYTWNFQPWLTRDTLSTGVRGYLSKSLPAARLVDALHAIAAGPGRGLAVARSLLARRRRLARARGGPDRPRGRGALPDHDGPQQPGDRRAHPALAQLDQVLHPLGLPQDRRRLALQGRALGRRARHARRPRPDQRVAGRRTSAAESRNLTPDRWRSDPGCHRSVTGFR